MASFEHELGFVANIKKFTYKIAEQYKERMERDIEERDIAIAEGRTPPYFEVYDGIMTTPEVATFARDLLKKHPDYKFGLNHDCDSSYELHSKRYYELWVYREGEHYALGRIGYKYAGTKANKRSFNDTPRSWFVASRVIASGKYSDSRWQYYAQISKSYEKTVKAAEKYLRSYAPHEVADMTKGRFLTKMQETLSVAQAELRYTQYTGVDLTGSKWVHEFKAILERGHEFSHLDVREKMQEIVTRYDVVDGLKSRPINGYHIQTSVPKWGDTEQCVYVTEYNRLQVTKPDVLDPVRYGVSSLPDDIKGKLAVVMMLTDDKHVDGVGYRINEDQYWVMKDIV
jgi:hypothetical protein